MERTQEISINTNNDNKQPVNEAVGPSKLKYLILVRHGQRIDETFPDEAVDDCDEYWDTGITDRGKKISHQTGAGILKLLDEWGVLDQMLQANSYSDSGEILVPRIRFISSVFYRCLQTTQYLREGMCEYIKEQQQKLASKIDELKSAQEEELKITLRRKKLLKSLLDMLYDSKTHLEEACSEKTTGNNTKSLENLRIEKDKQKILHEFTDLKITEGEIFDYSGEHQSLTLRKAFPKTSEIFDACDMFYDLIIKHLLEAVDHNIYVIVAHGMYVNMLLFYLDIKLPPKASKVHYNSTTVIEFEATTSVDMTSTPGKPKHTVRIANELLHTRK